MILRHVDTRQPLPRRRATIPRALSLVLRDRARHYPVVTLTGPRQSGKTTLVKACFANHQYVSLEEPDSRSFAIEDPRGLLGQFDRAARLPEGVVLDEVQRAPDLFSYIQTLVDDDALSALMPRTRFPPTPGTLQSVGPPCSVCRARPPGSYLEWYC